MRGRDRGRQAERGLRLRRRACKMFCVSVGRNRVCLRHLSPRAGMRSSNMIAKWFSASLHFGIGNVHFFDASWIAR
jgi:hypothetical protein